MPALLTALAALILGLFCICALENVTMGLTMRTLDPRGVQAMLNLLLMTFSGNILPLTLFPDSWQRVITLLPYAQMLDAPIRLYNGEYALDKVPEVMIIQICWTVLLVTGGCLLWRANQKKMIVQGG